MKLYHWLYMHTPIKRPFTYALRDFYHEVEYVVIIGFFTLGYFTHNWLCPRDFWLICGGVTVGYILGHVFWGKRYISNQGTDEEGQEEDEGEWIDG